jgi:ATP/ADP translocase
MNNQKEKNPFFLPALIATLFPVIIFVLYYANVGRYFNDMLGILDALKKLLSFLLFCTPFAAIFLSIAGLVDARKLQEPFIGCLCCLILVFLEILGFLSYLSRPISHPVVPITPHSHTYEESASIESVNEEINRAMYGNATTRTTK